MSEGPLPRSQARQRRKASPSPRARRGARPRAPSPSRPLSSRAAAESCCGRRWRRRLEAGGGRGAAVGLDCGGRAVGGGRLRRRAGPRRGPRGGAARASKAFGATHPPCWLLPGTPSRTRLQSTGCASGGVLSGTGTGAGAVRSSSQAALPPLAPSTSCSSLVSSGNARVHIRGSLSGGKFLGLDSCL